MKWENVLFVLPLNRMKFICERIVCMLLYVNKDKRRVMRDNYITDSFDDFATRSSKFSYLWFFKAKESA